MKYSSSSDIFLHHLKCKNTFFTCRLYKIGPWLVFADPVLGHQVLPDIQDPQEIQYSFPITTVLW